MCQIEEGQHELRDYYCSFGRTSCYFSASIVVPLGIEKDHREKAQASVKYSELSLVLLVSCGGYSRSHCTPTNQSPMLVDSPTKRNLLSDFRTGRTGQEDLCQIRLYAHNPTTSRR